MSASETRQDSKVMEVLQSIEAKSLNGNKMLSVLIDPDKVDQKSLRQLTDNMNRSRVDMIFIGGSLLVNDQFGMVCKFLKKECEIPLIIFPGNTMQIDEAADALLFLSLISGRNPELLIGNHVMAAPLLYEKSIEVIPTGYMLIDGGRSTAVQYMSNTLPIPADKYDIAMCTALAGQMLGLRMLFMDAGSGALNPVPKEMIQHVKSAIKVPLIVGGGIRTSNQAFIRCEAGADVIVVGNAIEKEPSLIKDLADAVHAV